MNSTEKKKCVGAESLTNELKPFIFDGVQVNIIDIGSKLVECGRDLENLKLNLSEKNKEKTIEELDFQIKRLETYKEVLSKAKKVYQSAC